MKIAISGASGKTGYRIAQEALSSGFEVRALLRDKSRLPEDLDKLDQRVISLGNKNILDQSLLGCDALVIATGARPSVDLTWIMSSCDMGMVVKGGVRP